MPTRYPIVFSLLLMGFLLGAFCDAVKAEADGPDYWAVQAVPLHDHLNLRTGPSVEFSILARIPSGFLHLENLGCSPEFTLSDWERFSEHEREVALSLRWCRVRFQDQVGWVKGSYLEEGTSPSAMTP